MNDTKYIKMAEDYLLNQGIRYLRPGIIGRHDNNRIEIVFLVPEAADPTVAVIDPPDIRVSINRLNGVAELIHQM